MKKHYIKILGRVYVGNSLEIFVLLFCAIGFGGNWLLFDANLLVSLFLVWLTSIVLIGIFERRVRAPQLRFEKAVMPPRSPNRLEQGYCFFQSDMRKFAAEHGVFVESTPTLPLGTRRESYLFLSLGLVIFKEIYQPARIS